MNKIGMFLCGLLLPLPVFSQENGCESFLKDQYSTAKEYLIGQFKKYDMVVVCERHHREITQYELFLEVVKDPYFVENVGLIYTEIGIVNQGKRINEFLRSPLVDSAASRRELTSLFRDSDSSPYWHAYNFPWFLWELFKFNQTLPADKKIALYPTGEAFDWAEIKDSSDFSAWEEETYKVLRDLTLAGNLICNFEANPRGKALVIMNNKHAFMRSYTMGDGRENYAATDSLLQYFGERLCSVYLMGLAPVDGRMEVVKNGEWDRYFRAAGKTDVGFDLASSPFAGEICDLIPSTAKEKYMYGDIFTGLIYYRPIEEHLLVEGWPGFVDESFRKEFERRVKIFCQASDIEFSEEFLRYHIDKINNVARENYEELDKCLEMIGLPGDRAPGL